MPASTPRFKQWVFTLVVPSGHEHWQPFAARYTGWIPYETAQDAWKALRLHTLNVLNAQEISQKTLCLSQKQALDITLELKQELGWKEAIETLAPIFEGHRVDWALHPLGPEAPLREKKLLISDMDSTLLEGECIDELAALLGLKQQVSAITAQAMRGELPFEAALKERVALLKGLPVKAVQQVLHETPLIAGAQTLFSTLCARGAYTMIVSGGFTPFTQALAQKLAAHHQQANQLEVVQGCFTGQVLPPILGQRAKVEALECACLQNGVKQSETLALGDGANDLAMLQAAGMGIAFHAKPAVEVASRFRIRFGDLSVALFYQGISEAEWQ